MDGKLRINGVEYTGRSLSFDGSTLFVNGNAISLDPTLPKIQVVIEGSIENLVNSGEMRIKGSCTNVVNNGTLTLNGDCGILENFGILDC